MHPLLVQTVISSAVVALFIVVASHLLGNRRRTLKFLALLLWGNIAEFTGIWNNLVHWDIPCGHPQNPMNHSGVRVLVYGFAKTGTRTMTRALYQVGFNHSYHAEEFNLHVWSRLYDAYWERGASKWQNVPYNWRGLAVLRSIPLQQLSVAISRCRVDAVAFDGIERLFGPVFHVSWGAKVISLNWRPYSDYEKSMKTFLPMLVFQVLLSTSFMGSFTVLPYGVVLKVIDPLIGRPIENLLRSGGPPINQKQTLVIKLFHYVSNIQKIAKHWTNGLMYVPDDEEKYDSYFRDIRTRLPAEDLLEWDMSRHGWEDLCRFVGADCRGRKGKLPRAVNVLNFERDFPLCAAGAFLIASAPAWALNWWLLTALLRAVNVVFARVRKKND